MYVTFTYSEMILAFFKRDPVLGAKNPLVLYCNMKFEIMTLHFFLSPISAASRNVSFRALLSFVK